MRILVLGGTRFLGLHFARVALTAGHDVTVFHRGTTGPGAVPGASERLGDRDGHLDGISDETWDAVVDTSGYVPRVVRESVSLLRRRAPYYLFVSTISVYADFRRAGVDEDAPVATVEDRTSEDVEADYGALKALCEEVVRDGFPAGAMIVRPGLIVGPNDPTDRFTYWPMRILRPGAVLAPGRPERPIQFIDARDLATWMLSMVERCATGTFNAASPAGMFTMGALLDTTRRVLAPRRRVEWLDEDFLFAHDVGEWMELPLWLRADGPMAGMLSVSMERAVTAGLRLRPLADTVADTAQWAEEAGRWKGRKAGMATARERELISAWRRAQTGGMANSNR